jgi:hypothetical protein
VAPVRARAALLVLALIAGAWLVAGYRSLVLEARGEAILEESKRAELPPGELERGRDYFERARRLNADNTPLLDESLLLAYEGHHDEAVALAEQVVAEEPENLDGWISVYLTSLGAKHPRRAAVALREIRRLNPRAAAALEGITSLGS